MVLGVLRACGGSQRTYATSSLHCPNKNQQTTTNFCYQPCVLSLFEASLFKRTASKTFLSLENDNSNVMNDSVDTKLARWERNVPWTGFSNCDVSAKKTECNSDVENESTANVNNQNDAIHELAGLLVEGRYVDVLRSSETAVASLFNCRESVNSSNNSHCISSVRQILLQHVHEIGQESVQACIILELVGIAALQLFLQLNYTGPTLSDELLDGVNPHQCFLDSFNIHRSSSNVTIHEQEESNPAILSEKSQMIQNAFLSELAVDGEWPCQVCKAPYLLLVARSILTTLSQPTRPDWTYSVSSDKISDNDDDDDVVISSPSELFQQNVSQLHGVHWWNSRCSV
jgi:hypothetical protein